MSNNRNHNKWNFFLTDTKPALSAADVRYWKQTLRKIGKVGLELEFNLPEGSGNCDGSNDNCPCSKLLSSDCWSVCIRLEDCNAKYGQKYEWCASRNELCNKDQCAECNIFEFKCAKQFCSHFVSACIDCSGYTRDCTGCAHRIDPEKNPEYIRSSVIKELNPTGSYGAVNGLGVHSITTDGSLLGGKGMEVITVGRRPDFAEFYVMLKEILDAGVKRGAYVNERCSIHMHLLATYFENLVGKNEGVGPYVNELERPLPQIILANFHQLCRKYQNAITWMTMGLGEEDRLTRWERYRVSVLDISPTTQSMSQVQRSVAENAGGTKYGWVNYNYTNFTAGGDVSRLHFEMRVCDFLVSPSAVAAVACMLFALLIKAVEISRYGLLDLSDSAWLRQAHSIKEVLLNNRKDWKAGDRFSDTSKLKKYYGALADESRQMIGQLKHILMDLGPAYQVLERLAEEPCALKLVKGITWAEIEEHLKVPVAEETAFDSLLGRYIDLRLIAGCESFDQWVAQVGAAFKNEIINIPSEEVETSIRAYYNDKSNNGEVLWSSTIGTVVHVI